MQRTDRTRHTGILIAALGATLVASACGGGAGPTAAPPTPPPAAQTPTAAPATSAPATNPSTGEPSIGAPATVGAGAVFDVTWTGPNGAKDYITILKAGAAKWTDEQYFYTASNTSPGKLTAPAEPGAYQLWYVNGEDDSVLFRLDITVDAFVGSVDGPDSVAAGAEFEIVWSGPAGPGDYVTIVKAGSTRWTNEPYFYTASNPNPHKLQAPIEAGAYELWYVLGADDTIGARAPITVLPVSASVTAPTTADKGSDFEVAWTGPNGPGDFITIVEAGAPEAAYLDYCYTSVGPTCTLTAPDASGAYEVRYTTAANKVIATTPIAIK